MKYILTLLCAVALIAACKKDNNQPTQNNNQSNNPAQPITGDSTLKIKGLDSLITITVYDSIDVPITIESDSGIAQNISIAISSKLPMRMKAVLAQTSGTTPFTTTLKLYTYLTIPTAYLNNNGVITWNETDTILIKATKPNGDSAVFVCNYKIMAADCRKLFYEVYKRNPTIRTYQTTQHNLDAPAGPFVSDNAELRYDITTDNMYLVNAPLAVSNGKIFLSLYDSVNYEDNMYSQSLGSDDAGNFYFFGRNVLGMAGSDVDTFFIGAGIMNYYRNNLSQLNIWDDSTFTIDYRTHDFRTSPTTTHHFFAIGKLTF